MPFLKWWFELLLKLYFQWLTQVLLMVDTAAASSVSLIIVVGCGMTGNKGCYYKLVLGWPKWLLLLLNLHSSRSSWLHAIGLWAHPVSVPGLLTIRVSTYYISLDTRILKDLLLLDFVVVAWRGLNRFALTTKQLFNVLVLWICVLIPLLLLRVM